MSLLAIRLIKQLVTLPDSTAAQLWKQPVLSHFCKHYVPAADLASTLRDTPIHMLEWSICYVLQAHHLELTGPTAARYSTTPTPEP